MSKTCFQLITRCQWCLLAASMAWASAVRAQEYDPDWSQNFRVGMLVGFNINANFRMSGTGFPISGNNPGPVGVPGPAHRSDDGSVL